MRQRAGRSTIKEVASAAGVSTQTVSRVLNNRPDVASETRKRVKDIVRELSYQPSALARSLISQRSYTLGVVTAGLRYIGPHHTLSGIASAAENAGYSLILKELLNFDTNDVGPIFRALLSRHVDGIIWAVPKVGDNHDWVNSLPLDVEVPIVYLTTEPQENNPIVSINNYTGGQIAVSHLLEQGYQNIGHISGPMDWWEARQRMIAWKDTLKDAGFQVKDNQWIEGNWTSASGAQAMKNLLEHLGANFRHVIIDSPPVLAVTDATILSSLADGVLLVAASGSTPRAGLVRARRILGNAGARILGVTMNKLNQRSHSYQSYGYSDFYNR